MADRLMQKATEVLQQAGIRMTPQRRVILHNLYHNRNHPTVEELFRQICDNYPGFHSLSTTTIYNNMRILKKHGLVKEIYSHTGITRYDGNIDTHHHLVCKVCDKITDSYFPLPLPISQLQDAEGFSIDDVYIEIRGICPSCQESAAISK